MDTLDTSSGHDKLALIDKIRHPLWVKHGMPVMVTWFAGAPEKESRTMYMKVTDTGFVIANWRPFDKSLEFVAYADGQMEATPIVNETGRRWPTTPARWEFDYIFKEIMKRYELTAAKDTTVE